MNRNDGAVGDARKRAADDYHIATGRDLPARKSYVDLADLIADDTDEPMWSAVVIAKHILDSDWMARVIADAKAEALREVASEWSWLRRDAALFDYGRWINAAVRMLHDRAERIKDEATR